MPNSNLEKIIKLTQAQYDILSSGGTVGDYTGLNDNYLYLIQDDTEYITDVKVNNSSIVSSGVANLVTNSAYDASSNKIATMSDIKNGTLTIQGSGTAASTFTANQSGDTTLNIKGSGATSVTKTANNEITISTPSVTDTNQKVKQGSVTFGNNDVVNFVGGGNVTITGNATDKTMTLGVASGYSIPSTTDQTAWFGKYSKPSGGIPASDLAEKYVRYDVNTQSLTDTQKSNARTNIGAGTSNLALGSTSSTAAAGDHAHGNITNSGTITSTAVTSATGVLVYDSNNKIQRATAANARSIIGAGTGNGDVTGPSSSTTNHVATFSDGNGKTIKDSGATLTSTTLTLKDSGSTNVMLDTTMAAYATISKSFVPGYNTMSGGNDNALDLGYSGFR